MELDKQFVIDEGLKKQRQSQQVQQALDQLPAKVDHEHDAALLEKLRAEPGAACREGGEKKGSPSCRRMGPDAEGEGKFAHISGARRGGG